MGGERKSGWTGGQPGCSIAGNFKVQGAPGAWFVCVGCSIGLPQGWCAPLSSSAFAWPQVMELCEGGALLERIESNKYSEAYIAKLLRSILRFISQCHAKGIIYRQALDHLLLIAVPCRSRPAPCLHTGYLGAAHEGMAARCTPLLLSGLYL